MKIDSLEFTTFVPSSGGISSRSLLCSNPAVWIGADGADDSNLEAQCSDFESQDSSIL
jgi:hypothetical protein